VTERTRVTRKMQELFQECEHLCGVTILLRELTPRACDMITSLGERLSALLIAAVLAERGVRSDAVNAAEIVVTDSWHGAAEPFVERTQERSHARLRPVLQQGVVPVVTGFIGATPEGVLTTLGRGGSDYSATILAAALEADEVTIWTDVDGLLTANPRLVPGARTIPEISYHEAAELAYFGAKVLHSKTLRAVTQCGIPLWIRNTFAPERYGTKITPAGPPSRRGVKALTAISDVSLITLDGPRITELSDVLDRISAAVSALRADVLLAFQPSYREKICLVVSSAVAKRTVEALRREWAREVLEPVVGDPILAMVTLIGHDMNRTPEIIERTLGALDRESVSIIAHGSSQSNVSLVVAQEDMRSALISAHQEFQLGCAETALPAG
jgi:bifunctional aspartokinase / homoserine dehydrogenase 1